MTRLPGFLAFLLSAFLGTAAAAEDTIRMGLDSLPLSFGVPYRTAAIPTIYTTSAIFDGLTRIDAEGNLSPWLATAWDSADGVTWSFTLREDVTFSNGKPFTAGAVKVAVDYLASDDALREGLVREIPRMTGARVIDDHTVEITLEEPDPLFPRSAAALFIAEPEQWLSLGREGFGKEPVGTGPFQLVRWEPNRAVLTAFKGSWRPPQADGLEIYALPDRASRMQALLSGQIDLAVGMSPDELYELEAMGGTGYRIQTAQVFGWSFMLMRDGQKVEAPWSDPRVRRALTMAVNRQLIVDALLDGRAAVANQPAAKNVFGRNPDIQTLPHDPAAAKALLAEAGYPDGFSFTLAMAPGAASADVEINQRVADDLSQVGVKVEIRTMPVQQYLQSLSRATFETDAFGMAWPADPSVDAIRPLRLHSCLRREPWYCDEGIMPLVREAMAEMDPERGLALRREIMAWYAEQAPAIFLYEGTRFIGAGPGVSGVDEANGMIAYDRITLAR